MSFDLSAMSLKELKKIHNEVGKAIENYGSQRKRQAIEQLEARARELGFKLDELVDGFQPQKTRAATIPRYRNPEPPFTTWSGRGRKPEWFAAALAAGKTPEDLAI